MKGGREEEGEEDRRGERREKRGEKGEEGREGRRWGEGEIKGRREEGKRR